MANNGSIDERAATNPVFGEAKLKLGLFGFNGPGVAFTKVPELFDPTWHNSLDVGIQAEKLGIDALVPYARWRAIGNLDHARSFETSTWAAAMSASTSRTSVMATTHVQAYNPVVAAKTMASVDQISGGRFAMNIVCGWMKHEIEMFGQQLLPHDDRYAMADEWITIIKRLWTEDDPVTFSGKYYTVKDAIVAPRPVQPGGPALMNAGGSDRGRHFAAKHADIAFITAKSDRLDDIAAEVAAYKSLAREEYGRDVQVWLTCYVVQRDTMAEATDYVRHYVVDHGDIEMADTFIAGVIENSQFAPREVIDKLRYAFMAGIGGFPLVGRADDIARSLRDLSDCGVDGVLLTWVEYQPGLEMFGQSVLPLLQQMGLR